MTMRQRDRALLENVQDVVLHVGRIVAAYRKQLEDDGMDPNEAWELCVRLEERLLGPVFDQAEAELKPAPWADIEALFVACINLQLVLGQAPSAIDAVRYMRQAGVRLSEITPERADRLARRTSIGSEQIAKAFADGIRIQCGPPASAYGSCRP